MIHRPRAVWFSVIVVLVAIVPSCGRVSVNQKTNNPIASCGSELDELKSAECISLRLDIDRLESAESSGAIAGIVTATNSCDTSVALLASPIDTRVRADDAWEGSLGSVYATLSVYQKRTTSGGLDDRGAVVRKLPAFVIVPANGRREWRIEGASPRLAGLQNGAAQLIELCTFAAPVTGPVSSSTNVFDINRSIEMHEHDVKGTCAVTLRKTAVSVCTPSSAVQVSRPEAVSRFTYLE